MLIVNYRFSVIVYLHVFKSCWVMCIECSCVVVSDCLYFWLSFETFIVGCSCS
ncbi:hypothetical protein Hanom_Chr16g01470171 [Helianthus anomalus]